MKRILIATVAACALLIVAGPADAGKRGDGKGKDRGSHVGGKHGGKPGKGREYGGRPSKGKHGHKGRGYGYDKPRDYCPPTEPPPTPEPKPEPTATAPAVPGPEQDTDENTLPPQRDFALNGLPTARSRAAMSGVANGSISPFDIEKDEHGEWQLREGAQGSWRSWQHLGPFFMGD